MEIQFTLNDNGLRSYIGHILSWTKKIKPKFSIKSFAILQEIRWKNMVQKWIQDSCSQALFKVFFYYISKF